MNSQMPIIYTHKNVLKTPHFWIALPNELKKSFILGKKFFYSEFKSTYREAFLGTLWTALPSFFMTISYLLAENSQIVSTNNDSGAPNFIFLIVGLLNWQNFIDAVQAPIQSLIKNKKLFLKINIPIETFIFAKFFEVGMNTLLRFFITLSLLHVFFQLPSFFAVLMSFGYTLLLVSLGYTIGLWIVPLGTLIQDFQKIIGFLLGFLLFCTPVFYMKAGPGLLQSINYINPLSSLVIAGRSALISSNELSDSSPIYTALLIFIFLSIGLIYLRLLKPFIYERMGL